MFTSLKALLLVLAMFLLAACAGILEGDSSSRLATMYATIKLVDGDAAKADRIEAIATEVRAYATGEEFLTVDLLIVAIQDRVRWDKLDAADKLLVQALLDQLRTELVARLGADVLPEDLRLAVDTVATWVLDAARMT